MARSLYCLVFLFLTCFAGVAQSAMSVAQLRCDDQADPLGVESPRPALSWQMRSEQRGQVQTAYRVLVADDATLLDAQWGNVWDSGKQNSDASIQVPYAGKPLQAGHRYYWKVQSWDKAGEPSAWSAVASWQMGLVTPA